MPDLSSRLANIPQPTELKKQAVDREAALPTVEEAENKPELSVQDRGDAIISNASARLSGFLTSMQARMSGYAERARKALGFGAGAVAAGAESVVAHGGKLASGMKEGLVGAAKGATEIPGFIYDDVVKPVGEAVRDLVQPEAELSPAEQSALANIEIQTIKAQEKLRDAAPADRESLAQQVEALNAAKEQLLSKPRARSIRGSATAAAAGRAVATGAGAVAGGVAMGAMGAVALGAAGVGKVAEGGRWAAGKADAAVVGAAEAVVDNVVEPAMEYGAEKKAKYLEVGAVMSEALSKLAGKDVKLTDAQMIAIGASMDAGGFLKDIAEKGADAMAHMLLIEDGIEIAQNLTQAGVDLVSFVRNPEERAWLVNELKEFNIKGGAAIEDAARTVGRAAAKPILAAGRGIATGASVVAGGVAAGALGAVALGAAGVGAAVEGGRYIGRKASEGYDTAKTAAERKAMEVVNNPAVLELRNNIDKAPADFQREVKKVDKELVELTKRGTSFYERMKKRVEDFMSTINAAFNKLREPMITEAMATEHPDLAAGIPAAIDALPQIDAAAMEANRVAHEENSKIIAALAGSSADATETPMPRIAPVKRPAPKL